MNKNEDRPNSGPNINGVDILRVGRILAGQLVTDGTANEYAIARAVDRRVSTMERKGYAPAQTAQAARQMVQALALRLN